MPTPVWVDPAIVPVIHAEQIEQHGGRRGLRDAGLLDSALQRSRNLWLYSDPKPDLASLAASLAYGVCRNHPFFDGNKRTAWVLCRTFLIVNESDVQAGQTEVAETVQALAAGEIDEVAFAAWLRERLTPGE